MSQDQVASAVGCVRRTIFTHLRDHIGAALAAEGTGKREELLSTLSYLEKKTDDILRKAMSSKMFETALRAIARREAQVKLVAEITGQLQEKAPNEDALQKRARQFERAIDGLVASAKAKGLSITPKQAIEQIRELEPSLMEVLHLTKFKLGLEAPQKVH